MCRASRSHRTLRFRAGATLLRSIEFKLNEQSQRFYHGTKANLKPGDLIEPGYSANYGTGKKAAYVYLTCTLNTAVWAAEMALGEGFARVYIVEPTGPITEDINLTGEEYPGHPPDAYRSREPLRVVGEHTDWQGHSSEQLKVVRDYVERLNQLGIEPIND